MTALYTLFCLLAGLAIMAIVTGAGFAWFNNFQIWQGQDWQFLYDNFMAHLSGNGLAHWLLPKEMIWSVIAGASGGFMVMMVLYSLALRPGGKTVHGTHGSKTLHGSARFARMRDVQKASLLARQGVVLGGFQNKTLKHDGPEHIIAFAPTRSGKGVNNVIPTLLDWPHSTVVLDIKRELYALTSGYRASLGHRILPFDPTSENSCKFNPLAEVRIGTGQAISDVQRIANILVDPQGQQGDRYFALEGYSWLAAVIVHVLVKARTDKRDVPSLRDVSHFMAGHDQAKNREQKEDPFDVLAQGMMKFDHGDKAINDLVHGKASYMKMMADKQRSGVISMATLALSVFDDPIVARNTARSDFTLDSLMMDDNPSTLYLMFPPSDIKRLSPLMKMMMELIIVKRVSRLEFVGGTSRPDYRHRLLMLMDEFTAMGKLGIFHDALAYMASYGLKAFIIIQDFAQLDKVYSRENAIFSNCHVRLAFAPNRIETAKILSEMTGKMTVVQEKTSVSGKGVNRSLSISQQETSRPLMNPDEVMQLKGINKHGQKVVGGDLLIFVAGMPTILGNQRLFFQNSELLRRTQIPAPALPAKKTERRSGYASLPAHKCMKNIYANEMMFRL